MSLSPPVSPAVLPENLSVVTGMPALPCGLDERKGGRV